MGTPASLDSLVGDTGVTLYGNTERLIRETWRAVIKERPKAQIANLAGFMFNRLPDYLVQSIQVKGDEVHIVARVPSGLRLFTLRNAEIYMTSCEAPETKKIGVATGPGTLTYLLNTAFETGGFDTFLAVLKNIVRDRGYASIAKKAGLSESTVRRAFSPGYSPTLTTLHNILWALGASIKFSVTEP